MSLGAEAMKYLRDLVQSVCCIAKKVNPDPATIAVQQFYWEAGEGLVNPALVPLSNPQNTSLEVENFSESDFLIATLPNGSQIVIPPGGSKVIAVSAATTDLGGSLILTSQLLTLGGDTGVTADYAVQITEIYQP